MGLVAEEAKTHWLIWVVGYEIVTLFAVHVCSDSLDWCVKASFGVLLFAGITAIFLGIPLSMMSFFKDRPARVYFLSWLIWIGIVFWRHPLVATARY
jgi:hypothetical protein